MSNLIRTVAAILLFIVVQSYRHHVRMKRINDNDFQETHGQMLRGLLRNTIDISKVVAKNPTYEASRFVKSIRWNKAAKGMLNFR